MDLHIADKAAFLSGSAAGIGRATALIYSPQREGEEGR